MTETTEDFAGRLTAAIDAAGLVLLASIRHQTGLFDHMAALGPATSAEIARTAGLVERYVREWLSGMTVGDVVAFDSAAGTYRLPQHRAAMLTRSAGLDNMARLTQYVPLLCEVEQQIIPAFARVAGCRTRPTRAFTQ